MFPESTKLQEKFIPKEKFYNHGDFVGGLKTAMTNDIAKITAINKLSGATLNVLAGKVFSEIMVLKLHLKKHDFDIQILNAMDKSIRAAFVLFVIEYNGKQKLSIAFKSKAGDTITVAKRWTTDWGMDYKPELTGRSIDSIYEGLLQQISGGKLIDDTDKTLKEKVVCAINNEKLEKQIERLESKARNQPQLNKKMEIRAQIKKLKEQL